MKAVKYGSYSFYVKSNKFYSDQLVRVEFAYGFVPGPGYIIHSKRLPDIHPCFRRAITNRRPVLIHSLRPGRNSAA